MPKTDITYAELRDDDVLIARDGARWHVSGVEHNGQDYPVTFWLGDARTKVRAHHMTKPATDPCTVDRVELHADKVAKLEAGSTLPLPGQASPEENARRAGLIASFVDRANNPPAHDAAILAVETGMPGATVDVDVTAAELDAAAKSTDDDPVVLPLFESMTDLEQRSHLFVLHGVFSEDVNDRKELATIHVAAHRERAAGKLKGRHTPHVHSEAATA